MRPRAQEGPAVTGPPGGGPAARFAHRERPRNALRVVGRLWTYLAGERALLALIFTIVAVESLLVLSGPYLVGRGVEAVTAGVGALETPRDLAVAVVALFCAYVGGAVLSALHTWGMAGVSQRMIRRYREGLFGKIQRLPLAYFDQRTHGELMSRITNDVDAVSLTLSQSAAQLLSSAVVVVATLCVMLVLHPPLTLAALLPLPLVFLLTTAISRTTRRLFKEQQIALGELGGHVEEVVSGIQAVKAFGREPDTVRAFTAINERLRRVGTRAQVLAGFLMPMMNVIGNLGFAAVAIAGGLMAARGGIGIGLIATFIGYSRQFVRPLNEIANMYNTLMSAVAGAERVFEVMEETEETPDAVDAVPLRDVKGDVEFRDVSFGYRPEQRVLHGISFRAPPGSVTAIVGRTGAGKTTIVNLLSRFYEAAQGAILIDGRDIRSYTRSSLRRAFGVVLQEGFLFAGTVRENILYGRPGATEGEMMEAATLSGADHAIRRLPSGYDTVLEESGANLSQGERQLVAIARAVLATPSLLVLDEATSSVDARTELRIQLGMIELMRGRTSFIIAHRLSTIRGADTVLAVDDGRIVERGSPASLAQEDGYYRKLLDTQRRGVET